MADELQSVLDKSGAPKAVKAQAWNAYQAADESSFKAEMDKVLLPKQVKAQLWNLKFKPTAPPPRFVDTLIPRGAKIQGPKPETGSERFIHSLGAPTSFGEIGEMGKGMIAPQQSESSPGFGQNIPIVGPAFRAQRETYEQPGTAAKVYGSIPLVGPPAYAMGKALERGDIPTALGSAGNIVLQMLGMRKLPPLEGSVEASMKKATGISKPIVPYEEGAKASPKALVIGKPTGIAGRHIAQTYGLKQDLADRVNKRVGEIQKARQSAQGVRQGAVAAGEQAASRVEQSGTLAQDILERQTKQVTDGLEKQIGELKEKQRGAGQELVADTALAFYEEQEKVSKPFRDIGEKISEPVSTADAVRGIIGDAAKEKGVKPSEIPSSAYAALGGRGEEAMGPSEGRAIHIQDLPPVEQAKIRAQYPELYQEGIKFNDLTRVREDLYNAARANKDSATKSALYSAAERVTDLQEKVANSKGLGEAYAKAKRDYMMFRRGIGSSMVEDLLSARDMEEQALGPKLQKLITPSTAEGLRSILKSVGIDTAGFDQIAGDIGGLREQSKATVKGAKAEGARLASETAERAGAERKGAEAQAKIAETAQKGAVSRIEKTGAEVVPGKTVSELKGKSNEQLNRMRLSKLVEDAKGKGVMNPSGLIHMAYGVILMTTGHLFGAFPATYGAARVMLPNMLRSPAFQEWALRKSGVVPGSIAGTRLTMWLNAQADAMPVAVAGAPKAREAGLPPLSP